MLNFLTFQRNILNSRYEGMQMSELMISWPHNLPLMLFTEMMKIQYFSCEKVKLAFYPL